MNRGEDNPGAKLTEDDVYAIRARCRDGDTYVNIAEDYNVSAVCILHIDHRTRWKHLN